MPVRQSAVAAEGRIAKMRPPCLLRTKTLATNPALSGKALSARAMRHGIRIRNLEAPLLEIVAEIQFGPADEKRALRIDHHVYLIRLHKDIAVGGSIDQIHLILQSRASAADHRNPQGALRTTLPLKQGTQLRARCVTDANQSLVAKLVIDSPASPKNTVIRRRRKLAGSSKKFAPSI